ncbi:MAG: asparagine synthase (glutamine-hydrolyzing) [Verrucomicrobiota bacterium]
MCGIAGIISKSNRPLTGIIPAVEAMGSLQKHRGPDDSGTWCHEAGIVAFNHQRLSIIDVDHGHQPMSDDAGNWIVFNGEIYNYIELRVEIGAGKFRTHSDTETILQAYLKWGDDCVTHLRGMFAFAIWDERKQRLFCARDRFGIKPFYWAEIDGAFLFASEVKAMLPFVDEIATCPDSLGDYLTFQFCLPGATLFKGINELAPAHTLSLSAGQVKTSCYWEVHYVPDHGSSEAYFHEELDRLLAESVQLHMRSDVPVGAYVSGGIDSSLLAKLGKDSAESGFCGGFNGKFSLGDQYDESRYAQMVADEAGFPLHIIDIKPEDFTENIEKIIYHLDYPVAGPGSFPQYMVSGLAAEHCKVVLGGQGGDEVFGGYTRYLVAYFEQCIRAAIDGTMDDGNFIVTYESIIPNLSSLRNYKPMLRSFWSDGLFEDMDRRYFKLVNRAPSLGDIIHWDKLPAANSFSRFQSIFHGGNVGKQSYFDLMTHFDTRTLLPALLQVEDRMSMAHGLESRVPLLDHPLIEMAASMPANVKFREGDLKHMLKDVSRKHLPAAITDRTDKMGFPTPLNEWAAGPLRDFVGDLFSSSKALGRDFIDNAKVLDNVKKEGKFGRNLWGSMCLEIWQTQFHDRAAEFRKIRQQTGFNS